MSPRRACAVLAWALLLWSTAAPRRVAAQVVLAGRVTDAAGTPLPEVRVRLLELERTTATGPDGRYRLEGLPAGAYAVAFSRIGFRAEVRRVALRESGTADVVLHPSELELPDIQVTASPMATSGLTSPQPTSVLHGGALAAAQAPSLGETLESVAGVRNWSTGVGIGKPVIRGLTSNRVIVLAGGQRLETQQWGEEHGPQVETADADRIEVIRGPASVLYGSDALGGVVHVVPRELPEAGRRAFARGRVAASYASNNRSPDGTVTVEGAALGLGFRASGTARASDDLRTPDGPLPNSGNRALTASAALGYTAPWGALALNYAHRDERLEVVGDPATQPDYTGYQRIGDDRLRVEARIPLGLSRLEVGAGFQENRRREYADAADPAVSLGLAARTWSGDLRLRHAPLGPLVGAVGVSVVGTRFTGSGQQVLIPNSTAANVGVYAFEQAEAGRWQFSAGARVDLASLANEATDALGLAAGERRWQAFSGNLGALVRLAEPVALVANLGRGFRAPTSYELFATGPHAGALAYEVGNPALRTETSFNTDLGVRVQTSRLNAELSGFVNRIAGYIYGRPTEAFDPGSGFRIYETVQGDARLAGVELAAEYRAGRRWLLRGSADYVRGDNTSTGLPLPWIPPLRAGGSIRFDAGDVGRIQGVYATASGEWNARQDRLDPSDYAPPAYALAGLGAGFSLATGGRPVSVDLSVRNLFDARYARFLSRYKTFALEQGRNVVLRVSAGL